MMKLDENAPTLAQLTEDWILDEMVRRIGCPWESIEWSGTEGLIILTLPNGDTYEFDHQSDEHADRAADRWKSYHDSGD